MEEWNGGRMDGRRRWENGPCPVLQSSNLPTSQVDAAKLGANGEFRAARRQSAGGGKMRDRGEGEEVKGSRGERNGRSRLVFDPSNLPSFPAVGGGGEPPP